MPCRGTDCRPTPLRRRAGRPQLKREPLGGALPPASILPLMPLVWRCVGRRAPRRAGELQLAAPHHSKAATVGRAAHVSGTVAAQKPVPRLASPTFREVRGALEHR